MVRQRPFFLVARDLGGISKLPVAGMPTSGVAIIVGSVFGMSMLPMFGVGVLGSAVSVGGADERVVLQPANNTSTSEVITSRLEIA